MISWLQITSGRGPEECCWVVARLSECIAREAGKMKIKARRLEAVPGARPGTLKSALFALEGEQIPAFASQFEGTVQWIGKSMFRPGHKRKNWYAGVNVLSPPDVMSWSEKELRIEKMRSSGPGGQHANKTETAIRVTHIPTGVSAFAQEERSQHLNRTLALSRLHESLKQKEREAVMRAQNDRWSRHNRLERGNPVRIYEGKNFQLKNRK